jgi:protein O-GlcNAc transferase
MNSNTSITPDDPSNEKIKFLLNLFSLEKFKDAENEVKKQILKYPNSSVLFNILGAIFAGKNDLDEAIKNYEKSIKINNNYFQAYNNLGIAFHKSKKIDKAIINYQKAIDINKNFAESYNNLGNAFVDLKNPKESLEYFEKAIKLKSDYAEAYNGLGNAYIKLGDKESSLKNYKKAIAIRPDYTEVYNNIGSLLNEMSRFDESLFYFKKSIQINPSYEKSYNNLGNLLSNLGQFDEATEAYLKALKLKPDYAIAHSNLLLNLIYKPNFDINFYLSQAKKFRTNCKTIKKNININYKYDIKPEKLRIGFISADFGNHPGGYFTLNLLKELKNKNLELISYPTIERRDEFSHHFKPLFSKWSLIEQKDDEEVIKEITNDKIHILIDAQGHSAKNRLPIFIYKPAPIQITWLGQGSTGIPEIDYFVGSEHLNPKNEDSHYVEKIYRLPEISQCFTPPDFNILVKSLPAIKNNFITFGCINKLTKVSDEVIELWSKILSSVPESKLLLKNKDLDHSKTVSNIIEKFKKNNINKEKLIFEGKSKTRKELLETYNKIDIALDPFPFQGNTTSIEAIWMGVPVIVLKGDRFIFHFGESINSNLNMNDWIAENKENYILKAIKFSSNLKELSNIRSNLRNRALKSPVFNYTSFATHFDDMLWKIWNSHINN